MTDILTLVDIALHAIFRNRNRYEYEVVRVSNPFRDIALFKIGPLVECYGVARNIEAALAYAETILFDSLQNEPETFDGEWLLHFARVDLDDIPFPETESEKIAIVKRYGINIDRAMLDYRRAHRTVEHWLESVFDAHSFTLKYTGDFIYWRRG